MTTVNGKERTVTLGKHAIDQLVSGYSEESVLYQMLFGLTSRQRRCLGDGGDLTEFVEIIEQKDAVLDQIEQLEEELEPLRAAWMLAPEPTRDTVGQRLNPFFDEIITIIQKTVSIEQDNERLLESRRQELAKALASAEKWRCQSPTALASTERKLAPNSVAVNA